MTLLSPENQSAKHDYIEFIKPLNFRSLKKKADSMSKMALKFIPSGLFMSFIALFFYLLLSYLATLHWQGDKMVMVACGWRHTISVSSLGGLYTYGWSKYGQLGHGDFEDRLVPHRLEALCGDNISQVDLLQFILDVVFLCQIS